MQPTRNLRRRHQQARNLRQRRNLAAALVALLALLLAACSDDSDGGSAEGDTYKIGYVGPNTGPAAGAGEPLLEGVRFAVEEINESGMLGEGVELELDARDSAGDPAQGLAALSRFTSEGASAVLCCGLSSVAGAMKPQLVAGDTPAVITSAILPGLPEPPNLHRTALLLSDPAYDQLVEQYTAENPTDTVVIGVTGDNDGMVQDAEVWRKAFEDRDVEVDSIDTNTGDTNFVGPATQVANLDPDVYVNNMLANEGTLMVKALRERGYDGTILSTYGIAGAELYEVGGDALDGVVFPVAFSPDSDLPMARDFVSGYEAATGRDADIYAAQGYTAMYFVAQGILDAGSGEPADVAEALSEITRMDTVYGPVVFEDGQAVLEGDALILQWAAGGSQEVWEP